MYSLSLSLCGYRKFRRVQNLNIIRWTILPNKIWNSYYTSGASRTCNPAASPIIPEGLKYKEVYGNFKPFMSHCYISDFVSLFLILIWSTVGQIVNVSGHFIEVWCVPSATCGSWLYQIKNSVLCIGGFVELIFNFLYYFNSLYYALYVCYVYSRNPIAVSPYVLPFLWVKVE
jgi:hypothetical protein